MMEPSNARAKWLRSWMRKRSKQPIMRLNMFLSMVFKRLMMLKKKGNHRKWNLIRWSFAQHLVKAISKANPFSKRNKSWIRWRMCSMVIVQASTRTWNQMVLIVMNGLIWQPSSHRCSVEWTQAPDITTHSFPVEILLAAKLHLNLVIIVAINSSAINTSYHISLANSLEVLKGIICLDRPSEINLDITSLHHRSSVTISQSTFRGSWRWYNSLQISK